MSKRRLADVVQAQPKRTALDLAEETLDEPKTPAREKTKPTAAKSAPKSASASRTTDRVSISLLLEERLALEDKSADLRRQGRRDLKTSRLARIAFRLLLEAPDKEIFRLAEEVPNLEQLRVRPK
jgi:hypothetical protein